LSGRIAALSAEVRELKSRLTALEPKPPAPVKVPAWAKTDSNTGVNYAGPPSVDQKAVPRAVTYPIKIDGVWRNQAGEAVPDPTAPEPAAPVVQRDAKQAREVALLDAQLDQAAPLSGANSWLFLGTSTLTPKTKTQTFLKAYSIWLQRSCSQPAIQKRCTTNLFTGLVTIKKWERYTPLFNSALRWFFEYQLSDKI
jgi:hypothetical protein